MESPLVRVHFITTYRYVYRSKLILFFHVHIRSIGFVFKFHYNVNFIAEKSDCLSPILLAKIILIIRCFSPKFNAVRHSFKAELANKQMHTRSHTHKFNYSEENENDLGLTLNYIQSESKRKDTFSVDANDINLYE